MRRLSIFTALAGYGGLLIALRPQWGDVASWQDAAADPEHALVDLLGLIGWALAAWVFTATVLAVAAQAPSMMGRIAAGAARIVTPRIARRMLEAGLGLALAVGPAGAAIAGTSDSVPAPIVAAAFFPNLDRPVTTPQQAGHLMVPIPTSTPTTTRTPTPAKAPAPSQTAQQTVSHPVVPGDTLWQLAAAAAPVGASPAVITGLWQRWYAANRAAIGADPNLLLPGELLSLPSSS